MNVQIDMLMKTTGRRNVPQHRSRPRLDPSRPLVPRSTSFTTMKVHAAFASGAATHMGSRAPRTWAPQPGEHSNTGLPLSLPTAPSTYSTVFLLLFPTSALPSLTMDYMRFMPAERLNQVAYELSCAVAAQIARVQLRAPLAHCVVSFAKSMCSCIATFHASLAATSSPARMYL